MFKEARCCGIGVVVRNEIGQTMGALCRKLELPLGALEVETKVVEEGVQFSRDLSLGKIVVESDFQVVINSLRTPGLSQSCVQKVIDGIRMDLCYFTAWEASHMCRSCNNAAQLLARYAMFITDYDIWVEDTPPMIVDQVLNDVGSVWIQLKTETEN